MTQRSITPLDNDPPASVAEDELVAELRIKDVGELLDQAHKELLVSLLAKLRASTATHQEMAILRNLLRDNGMVLSIRPRDAQGPQATAPAELPTLDDPDYENT
jgi:hypothetical protein